MPVGNLNDENVAKEQKLKYKLEKLEEKNDIYWHQCAHAHWLKGGDDRNTKFFHEQASERRRSRIRKLMGV